MEFSKKFISASYDFTTFEKYVPAPYMRRSFELKKIPEKAEIIITGLGFYDLFINGKRITKGILAPYISNSDDMVYYDEYNITKYLCKGENVVGVILGNGMQNSLGGYIWDFEKAAWRSSPKLSMALSINDEVLFESDETFKTAPSPITFDDLRCGEYYDSRLEQDGWCEAGFDDTKWNNAIVVRPPRGEKAKCFAEPIVNTMEITPVSIRKQGNGYVYDFGVNAAGICRLKVNGKRGQEIKLTHGEWEKDGEFTMDNIKYFQPDGYAQCTKFICNGKGEQIYSNVFAYNGFRYVLVEGITKEQATEDLLTYLVMNSDLKERGNFSCSDETANKLQEITRRSDLANFYYFPTDCPHREKNGWTGDASVSSEQLLLNLQPDNSYEQWLQNIRKAQREDGALPGIIPTGGWGFKWGNGPVWDSVLINLPYYMYIYRGNRRVVAENATAIFRYLNYVTTRLDEHGLIDIGLGDWCPPKVGADKHKAPTIVTDSIVSMDNARKAAFMFGELGMPLQQKFAQGLADELRKSIRKNLINMNTMNVYGNCQTCQAAAIFFDVLEPGEKGAAFDLLLKYIKDEDDHMDVGIVGNRTMYSVLSDFGYADLAYKLITQPTYPSFGNWVARGATSLWENFPREGEKAASLNHHFLGEMSAWFIKSICGINVNPTGKNVNEVDLKPHFIEALDNAQGFHIAPAGKIDIKWKRKGDKIELSVKVPKEITGKIILESGYYFIEKNRVISLTALKTGKYEIKKA